MRLKVCIMLGATLLIAACSYTLDDDSAKIKESIDKIKAHIQEAAA